MNPSSALSTAWAPVLLALGQLLIPEGLKTFGLFTLLLLIMLWMVLRSETRSRAKDLEIEKRDAQIAELKKKLEDVAEKRLEETRQMILVAKNGTETMAKRTENDSQFFPLMTAIVEEIRDLKDAVDAMKGPRRLPNRPRR